MIPRTILARNFVEANLSSAQIEDVGNVILNGYANVVPNTTNKKAWQWKETTTPPVNLPVLVEVTPAMKGWTTNYAEYYTYGPNQGEPTSFEYTVHSYTPATGIIATLGGFTPGTGYTPGTYTNVPTIGGSGTGATLDIAVSAAGAVVAVSLNSAGSGYTAGDGLTVTTLGAGYGFVSNVATITVVNPAGEPRWAQSPRRYYQNQLAQFVPPTPNQKAIQYEFSYPEPDSTTAPDIGQVI